MDLSVVKYSLHSLVDGDKVLIASDMDEFVDGELRSKDDFSTEEAFNASLGMHLGMHVDYNENLTGYEADKAENVAAKREIAALLENSGFDVGWYESANGVSVDANPYLMTKLAIDKGEYTIQENEDGSSTVTIPFKDGSNNSYDIITEVPAGETYLHLMEGMIPSSVMGAGTIAIGKDGVKIYPQSSTYADNDKLGKPWTDTHSNGTTTTHTIGNVNDGPYRASVGVHAAGTKFAETALLLLDNKGGRLNFDGFYEDEGNWFFPVEMTGENFHSSNINYDTLGRGSSGCFTMAPRDFKPMMQELFEDGDMTTVESNRWLYTADGQFRSGISFQPDPAALREAERQASLRALAERQASQKQWREQLLHKRNSERNPLY